MGKSKKSKKTKAEEAPEFPSRPAAEGTEVTVVVHDEERTLKAKKTKGIGWAITPSDAAEARALAQFSDEALDPPPVPDAPATADEDEEDEADDSTGPAEEGPTIAAANAEAGDGQEES